MNVSGKILPVALTIKHHNKKKFKASRKRFWKIITYVRKFDLNIVQPHRDINIRLYNYKYTKPYNVIHADCAIIKYQSRF